jgi:hypothetical protein
VYAGTRDPASTTNASHAAPNITFFSFDMSQPSTFLNIPKNADAVFVNVPGTENRGTLGAAGVAAAKDAGVSVLCRTVKIIHHHKNWNNDM